MKTAEKAGLNFNWNSQQVMNVRHVSVAVNIFNV